MTDVVHDERTDHDLGSVPEPNLGWAVAGLCAGAGVVHFAMVPVHAENGWQDPFMFAAAGWVQLGIAAVILSGRARTRLYQFSILANLAFIGMWAWSRTAGLPWGDHAGVAEDAAAIDVATVAMEGAAIAVAARLLLAPTRTAVSRLAPAFAAVAALGLATTVITSPDAASHGHGDTEAALTGLDALRAEIDETRCDTQFNIPAYWEEAEAVGVDTYWGGKPPAVEGEAMSADGHAHGGGPASTSTETTVPDPTGGRGSVGLDELVSATQLAQTSEIEAANLINALSAASEDDYDNWLWWVRNSGMLSHAHEESGGAEPKSGHGGHAGPQPWVAMTDAEDCKTLEAELDLARETAMKYPTAQDALDAGYARVTPYLSGIAAHYMKFSITDGEFDIEEPEMILYDGDGPEAAVIGLSYYIRHRGDAEPTQGFTGANDHGHRHIGLCNGPNGVIGDSTTTEEECARRGGRKSDGSSGWMLHAWVVPGCPSPWGVFSAATPVLDNDLYRASGKDGGGCAGSGVRERYGLDDEAATAKPAASTSSAGDEEEAQADAGN